MKKTFMISAALLVCGLSMPAMATMPNAPRGAVATGCDMDEYTPVFGKDGSILYWNNPTCPTGGSSSAPRSGGLPDKSDWPSIPRPEQPIPKDDDCDEDTESDNDGVENEAPDHGGNPCGGNCGNGNGNGGGNGTGNEGNGKGPKT